MYGCESWTIKKAEHWGIDAFELWCWKRLLRVPWTARRSKRSILKEISPEYSLEGLMVKLKLQYFGYLMRRTDSFGKDPDAGKDWSQEEKGTTEDEMVGWHHCLDGHEFEWTLGVGDGPGILVYWSPWGHKELNRTEWLNWTRPLWPWDFPRKNTGVVCRLFIQGIFPTQGLKRGPCIGRLIFLLLSQWRSPEISLGLYSLHP